MNSSFDGLSRTKSTPLPSRLRRRLYPLGPVLALAWCAFGSQLEAAVVVRLGTLAPRGSSWHRILEEMGFEWKKATGGEIVLKIYPGGIVGEEGEMIRKMRIGQLQAAAISDNGLAEIDRAAYALMIPGMFESYEEWDYVRSRMNPDLGDSLKEKGFVVLTWSDVGWVYFFAKQPLRLPGQLEKLKLAASVADPVAVEIMKWMRLNPVPITVADMVTGLQTGLIDAFYLPIILAESSNLYRYADHMTDMRWAALQGAVVLWKESWQEMTPEQQGKVLEIARKAGKRLQEETRHREAASLQAMQARGLKVVALDDSLTRAWVEKMQTAYDKIREELVTPEVFDRVLNLRNEYRLGQNQSGR